LVALKVEMLDVITAEM
jgi:surfactin synthase thioesterase subunit